MYLVPILSLSSLVSGSVMSTYCVTQLISPPSGLLERDKNKVQQKQQNKTIFCVEISFL